METKITVRESAATAKHFIDIKKYNSGTGMETNITDRETSATDRHFTDIRKYNSASIIYNDDRSGATNFNCIFISKADRFTNLKKFYYKYSHICKSECVKVTVFPGSRKSNKGRKLYMRTGKSPGSHRNSPGSLRQIPRYVREIPEISGGFSIVFRCFSGDVREIPEELRYFSDKFRNIPGLNGGISGSFRQISEEQGILSGLYRDFPESYRVLSEVFIQISRFYRDFPEEYRNRKNFSELYRGLPE